MKHYEQRPRRNMRETRHRRHVQFTERAKSQYSCALLKVRSVVECGGRGGVSGSEPEEGQEARAALFIWCSSHGQGHLLEIWQPALCTHFPSAYISSQYIFNILHLWTFIHRCTCVSVCMPQSVYGDRTLIYRICSPSIIWVPGIKLRLSGLPASAFTAEPSGQPLCMFLNDSAAGPFHRGSFLKSRLLLPKFSQPTDWPSRHSSQHTEWELLPRQSLPIFSVFRCSLTEQNTLKMISLSLSGDLFSCTGSARACCHTAVGSQREHAASAQPAQIKAARLASSVSPRVRARYFNL